MPQLQAGLQPTLQEEGLKAEQTTHLFTQVTGNFVIFNTGMEIVDDQFVNLEFHWIE